MEVLWGIGGAAVGLLLGIRLYWPLKRWADEHLLGVWFLVLLGFGIMVLILRSDPVKYKEILELVHALGAL